MISVRYCECGTRLLPYAKFCLPCLAERGKKRRARRKASGMDDAHTALNRAVRNGKIPKLDGTIPCVDCGAPACDYDHRDYSKPLDVEPVCRRCNLRRGPAIPVSA